MYNSLQISADRRYSNGFRLGVAYTLSKSEDNGSNKRSRVQHLRRQRLLGPVDLRSPTRAGLSYIYDIPFWHGQETL